MIEDKETSHFNSLCNLWELVSRHGRNISNEGKRGFLKSKGKIKYDDNMGVCVDCVLDFKCMMLRGLCYVSCGMFYVQ